MSLAESRGGVKYSCVLACEQECVDVYTSLSLVNEIFLVVVTHYIRTINLR